MTTEMDIVPITRKGDPKIIQKANVGDGQVWSYQFETWGWRAFKGTGKEEPAVEIRIDDHMNDPVSPRSEVTIDGRQQTLTKDIYRRDQISQLFGERAQRQVNEVRVY